MKRLLTIGETMAAFTPAADGPLRYVRDYQLRIAGAESNLAIGIAKLGGRATWMSRLGADELGAFVLGQIRAEGVDCSRVLQDEAHPTGVMFKQTGVGETSVFYYRAGSAASYLAPDDLDAEWLESFSVIHLTGILPVLSESCLALCLKVFELAHKKGIPVSFDPNVRRKLWKDKDYTPMLREMAKQSTVLLLGRDEGKALWGEDDPAQLLRCIFDDSAVQLVAIKDGANGSIVADRNHVFEIPPFACRCIEPIGAGDAYNAGFLSGWMRGDDLVTCGRRGNIAGAMATQTKGDIEGIPTEKQMMRALENKQDHYR